MRKVFVVAWREFKYTALTKTFIIGTIIFPLLIWTGIAMAPFLVTKTEQTVTGTLAIVDPTGLVIRAAKIEFDPDRVILEEQQAQDVVIGTDGDTPAARGQVADPDAVMFGSAVRLELTIEGHEDARQFDAIRERVRAGELAGLAKIDPKVLRTGNDVTGAVTLYVPQQANPDHIAAITRSLSRSVVRARAAKDGFEVDQLRAVLRPPTVATRRLTDVGERAAGVELQRLLPVAFMFLLWISAFASGNYLLTTTIEEKSNKVMEVLLSAVSPLQLMTGKILGQAVVGLMTIAVYAALGIAALTYFHFADLIELRQIVYLTAYFFMAYFMIAAVMAGIGSAVSDLQEAHALITPAMLVLFIPMVLFVPVSQSPNGMLAVVSSFIPPLTPFVMIIRVTSSEPIAAWHVPLSMIVGFAGVVALIWLCARIFRVGVLMYGKPPSPLELIKWIRYA